MHKFMHKMYQSPLAWHGMVSSESPGCRVV